MRDAHCCDCGIGTIAIDEWYMVADCVWDQAWPGRRKSYYRKLDDLNDAFDAQSLLFEQLDRFAYVEGQEILCIGCLENRIGRTLCRTDFINVPINDPSRYPNKIHSDRLLDRLAADVSHLLVARRPA
jgi:hypothetical protein